MKSPYGWFSLLLICILVTGSEAASSDDYSRIRGPLFPMVSLLTDGQKAGLFEAFKDMPNYGQCNDTILACVNRTKPDPTAVRNINFGAYLVSKGVHPGQLGKFVRERGKFITSTALNSFTIEETPVMGNENAKITIVEFAEFKCPYCVTLAPILKNLVADSNGTVRLVFKHYPLKNHPGTLLTSQAAQAAYRQGKFWEMYDLLYKQMNLQDDKENPQKYAQELGLDLNKFNHDFEDKKLLEIIERDKMEGVRAKVTGTPTLFINGKLYNFRHDEDFLKDIINDEAEHLGIKPPYPEWTYP